MEKNHEVSESEVCTWLSTSTAMSINISCSSRMLDSSFMMSLCLASMSFSDCRACCVSVIIYTYTHARCNHIPMCVTSEKYQRQWVIHRANGWLNGCRRLLFPTGHHETSDATSHTTVRFGEKTSVQKFKKNVLPENDIFSCILIHF